MPIRALLFDLDDTLFETHFAHQEAVRLCCERLAGHYPEWTPASLHEAFIRTYARLEAQLEAGHPGAPGQTLFRTRAWEETVRGCGLPLELGRGLAEHYLRERRIRYRLFEDVPQVLEELSVRYTLVLVTNGLGEIQREKVAAVGLERWFRRLVISGEVGSWKPDAAIFRTALEIAGVTAGEAVMIGDSLERDVRGARALGIRTLWMRRYEHLQPLDGIRPDGVAGNAGELAAVLARWEAAGEA